MGCLISTEEYDEYQGFKKWKLFQEYKKFLKLKKKFEDDTDIIKKYDDQKEGEKLIDYHIRKCQQVTQWDKD